MVGLGCDLKRDENIGFLKRPIPLIVFSIGEKGFRFVEGIRRGLGFISKAFILDGGTASGRRPSPAKVDEEDDLKC